ncbi:Release factor glutamine methyltransferase [Candidatus Hepatoplasma crinochetorum Av]|uniref:peptide chain release factor N(5)-glutamine methyltransferase n=1 Tax=Candidatus Hepatoplasma crinochetorum Av TaxID=1427984 RepID=W8GF47_9MOLU|nr:HemK/PrmC family methyltransferase [Candidatus Hepatoplasma crinochetorum]AHK22233.1 Release factor glutamine methyltransferase [Candidatus Hepatoplasma crinochetorum Av]
MIFFKKRYTLNDLIFKKDLNYRNNLYLFLANYFEKDIFYFFQNKEKKFFTIKEKIIINYKVKKIISNKDLNSICQKKRFYNLDLKLNKSVFIPQYDTEGLVEIILSNEKQKKGIEIGIGTGAIILSILKNSENTVDGIDINKKAIKLTNINAKRNNIDLKKETILKKNVFKIKNNLKYDFLVANPPYISYDDQKITKIVKKIQPKKALYAKEKGFYFYKYLIKNNEKFLKENGRMYFEIGLDQDKYLENYLADFKKLNFYFVKDLNNINRYLVIKKIKD